MSRYQSVLGTTSARSPSVAISASVAVQNFHFSPVSLLFFSLRSSPRCCAAWKPNAYRSSFPTTFSRPQLRSSSFSPDVPYHERAATFSSYPIVRILYLSSKASRLSISSSFVLRKYTHIAYLSCGATSPEPAKNALSLRFSPLLNQTIFTLSSPHP